MAGTLAGIGSQVLGPPGKARLARGVHGCKQHPAREGDILQQLGASRIPAFLGGDVRAAPLDKGVQCGNDRKDGRGEPCRLAKGEKHSCTHLGAADDAGQDLFVRGEGKGLRCPAEQGGQLRRSVIRVLELVQAGENETGGQHGAGENTDKRHEFPPGWTSRWTSAGEPVLVLHFCGIFARRPWL
ncbi:hypothetical protein D9M72_539580 [compost metagenome]